MDTATLAIVENINDFLDRKISSVKGEVHPLDVGVIEVFFDMPHLEVDGTVYRLVIGFKWRKPNDERSFAETRLSLYRDRRGKWLAVGNRNTVTKNHLLPFLRKHKIGAARFVLVPGEYAEHMILTELEKYDKAGKVRYEKKVRRVLTEHFPQ